MPEKKNRTTSNEQENVSLTSARYPVTKMDGVELVETDDKFEPDNDNATAGENLDSTLMEDGWIDSTSSELKWWTILNEQVLHPHFLILLTVGGLPKPGQAVMSKGFAIYFNVLRVFFLACLIICASRLVVHSRPAYYNVWTNLAFVLL